MVECVRAPRRPGAGSFADGSRAGRRTELLQCVTDTEVGRKEDVGVAERPHRDVGRGPWSDPGRRSSASAACRRSAPRSSESVPSTTAAASAAIVRRRAAGIGRSGSAPASTSIGGNGCVGEPGADRTSSDSSGDPYVATSLAVTVRAAATDTCWPSAARTARFAPSTDAADRRPGLACTSRPITGSDLRTSTTAAGSASRSSSRRHLAREERQRGPRIERLTDGQPEDHGARRGPRHRSWCSTPGIPGPRGSLEQFVHDPILPASARSNERESDNSSITRDGRCHERGNDRSRRGALHERHQPQTEQHQADESERDAA